MIFILYLFCVIFFNLLKNIAIKNQLTIWVHLSNFFNPYSRPVVECHFSVNDFHAGKRIIFY